MKLYEPRPGSVPDRAIKYLKSLGPSAQLTTTDLCKATGTKVESMKLCMQSAINHGAIIQVTIEGSRISLWRLGTPRPKLPTAKKVAAPKPEPDDDEDDFKPTPAPPGPPVGVPNSVFQLADAPLPSPTAANKGGRPWKNGQPAVIDEPKAICNVAVTGLDWKAPPTVPVNEPTPTGSSMRMALWSDGTFEIRRTADDLVLFTAEQTREICHYLERLGYDA